MEVDCPKLCSNNLFLCCLKGGEGGDGRKVMELRFIAIANFQDSIHQRSFVGAHLVVKVPLGKNSLTYLIFVIFFTQAKFLEDKIYTEKCQFFVLNL